MDFKNYSIVPNMFTSKSDLFLTTIEEIAYYEGLLNVTFENDYKEYVLTYGNGILGGTYIRIYLPKRIWESLLNWKARITEYWFWDEGKDVLIKEEVLNSIRIGDTFAGDEIIFLNNAYYILPRQEEIIFKVGEKLGDLIDWLCSSGTLTEPFKERNFEPFDPGDWTD
ncbi:SMI1/KNR4 family protein [Chryseobacterium paridis]|uniref:SMI1/KNR4 family protein n=1 Tax=Chryseobacterium paridis TaxID=2800328 RepID=A0ABS1FV79_9FLAO|nr:SMI1/KNR4 family protein [Chryseobacterium paridis]MBK1896163.1 SMI1/KNR4 family protein [Chryseobacterium paridis]